MKIENTARLRSSSFSALLLLLGFGALAAQPSVELLPAAAGDLQPTELTSAPALALRGAPPASREAVSMSWPLATDRALGAPQPAETRSRSFWRQVSAQELRDGIALVTTGPGAVVRINPTPTAGGELALRGAALDPLQLTLRGPDGLALRSGAGLDQLASREQIAASGLEMPPGSAAFRIQPRLGAGRFELRLEESGVAVAPRYTVQVFDPQGDTELVLRANRASYLDGDLLRLRVRMELDAGLASIEGLEGFVTSPAGRAWPLRFASGADGEVTATVRLDAAERAAPGLWEAEIAAASGAGDEAIVRTGRIAFHCALATARLDGGVARLDSEDRDSLVLRLGIETATAGRYELRGLLYGTDGSGELRPMASAHSAAWLEAGAGEIVLSFEPAALRGSALKPPYEIRHLELRDQGRMGLLHRQARGVLVGD